MPRLPAVAFDVGGVLADDMHGPMLKRLAKERYAANRYGSIVDAGKTPWHKFMVDPSYPEDEFWSEVIHLGGLSESVQELRALLRSEMRAFPEILAIARRLRGNGHLIAILSNHCKPWWEELIARFRLDTIFDNADCILSYRIGSGKPKQVVFEKLIERVRAVIPGAAASDILFVDDKDVNVKAAEASGLRALAFDARKHDVRLLMDWLRQNGADVSDAVE